MLDTIGEEAMKVYYFNDRHVKMVVRAQTSRDALEDFVLEAHQGSEYNILIPSGHMLFIKEWDYSVVLITSMEKPKSEY